MYIQNNDVKPATSQNCIWHPINNKLYYLYRRYYSVYKNILFSSGDYHFLFHRKKYNP
jgi:hypothetical protein